MKILFFVSGSVRSNFSYRVLALARSLRLLGHDVAIVAPVADKYNDFVPETDSEIDGVRILHPFQFVTRRIELNLLPYLFGAIKALFNERPDLIYIYKPTPISVIGLLGKFFFSTPVVADFDDLGSEVMRIEGHPFHQRKLVEWSERGAARYADRIVAASSYLFDIFSKRFPKKPVYRMPNGVDAEWFAEPPVPAKGKRIVFLGSLNRQSILDPLFEVLPRIVAKFPETQTFIMGDGKYLEYFKQRAKELKIEKNVTFTGWLKLAEARAHLHEGDIGYNYMPNEQTVIAASNMKVPQYMARGVTPLVSDLGDLPATVDFGNAGYIAHPEDLVALEETILYALDDRERLVKARNANRFSFENFDWDALAIDFDRWLLHKKSGGKKRIYLIATTVPGDVGGAELRNCNLLKQLRKHLDADIEAFGVMPKDRETASEMVAAIDGVRNRIVPYRASTIYSVLRALFIERVPPIMEDFKRSGIGDMFRNACERHMPDFVQIEQLDAYYCIRPHIPWLKKNGVTIVFDCHNVEHKLFDDSLKLFPLPKRSVGKYLSPQMKRLEIEAARQADMILACSRLDALFFKTYNAETYLIPNGIDGAYFANTNERPIDPTLIFMGGVDYPPNGDAMEFYLRSIHPRVKHEVPNATLLAIGTTKDWLRTKNLNDPSVKPLGFVDDIRPYLGRSVIGICPLRYGSGTRIKIMTYMAAGLPVVSTSKGAEGVGYVAGRDILIENDPAKFSAAIVALLKNVKRQEQIGTSGKDFILTHYDWNVIGMQLKAAYDRHDR